MKKLLLSLIAVLLLTGTVYAAGIPLAVEPKASPEVWTQEVYNNSGSALTSGTVVVWDCVSDSTDASFAYRTSWITTSTTVDDINVAGVVLDSSIPDATEGTIAIYGPIYARCADSSDPVTLDTCVGVSGTSGQAGDSGGGANTGVLGWAIQSGPVSTTYGGYGGTAGVNDVMIPIFVSISHEAAS